MASVAPKEIDNMLKAPLVTIRRVGPHPPGEVAWFEVKWAARLVADKDARKATPEDFESKESNEPTEKVPSVEPVYSKDDFSELHELAIKAVGNKKRFAKLVNFYEINVDGRKRSQKDTNFAVEVFNALAMSESFPIAPPVIPEHVTEADMKAEFVASWKKTFGIK